MTSTRGTDRNGGRPRRGRTTTRRRLGLAVGIGGVAALAFAGTALAAVVPTYTHTQTLQPTGATSTDFGNPLALAGDGATFISGVPDANRARGLVSFYTRSYTRTGPRWILQQAIQDPRGAVDDGFGSAVAVSADGNTVVATQPANSRGGNPGVLYVYLRSGARWALQQAIPNPAGASLTDDFGVLAAISGDGNTIMVPDSTTSTVYVFTRTGTTWSRSQSITAVHLPGPLAISADGTTAAIDGYAPIAGSADTQEAVYFYTLAGAAWVPQGPPVRDPGPIDPISRNDFGTALALSSDGDTALIGAGATDDSRGAVYFYTRAGRTWSLTQAIANSAQKITNDNFFGDTFGNAVALSGDGTTAVIGASGSGSNTPSGAAYIYRQTGHIWTREQALPRVAPDGFGAHTALSANGAIALVGAGSDVPGIGLVPSGPVAAFWRTTTVVPGLSVFWTLEHHWVQAQLTPKAGASHYTLFATSPTAAGRTGVCRVVTTGIGRRVRCSVTLAPGTWAITAQAESPSGIIAQTVRTLKVS